MSSRFPIEMFFTGAGTTEEPNRDSPELIPARMLNEFAYYPRLCYIEWVQGEFLDSADTVDGRFQHRRVDAGSDKVTQELETFHARSVYLTGAGVTCRIDLLEGDGGIVTPVDYKRGGKRLISRKELTSRREFSSAPREWCSGRTALFAMNSWECVPWKWKAKQ
jgi:hypothetical protein